MVSILETAFRDAIRACHPEHWMASTLSSTMTIDGRPVCHLFACGKAAAAMSRAALKSLPDISSSIIIVPEGVPADNLPPTVLHASHPYPGGASIKAGKTMTTRLASLETNEPFLFLLSGGASSLMEMPRPPLTVTDLAATARILMEQGFPIDQLNRVRTALSLIKGGGLGRYTRGTGTVLVMSDVPGDCIADIGSGPFSISTPCHPKLVSMLKQAKVWIHLPPRVREFLRSEPASTESLSCPATHHIVMDNDRFRVELKRQVERQGMPARLMNRKLTGEARDMGAAIATEARTLMTTPGPSREALIWGGETTVTVTGNGRGGRNQEAALGAMIALSDRPPIQCLFAGTDGMDGSSDAAGAIVYPGLWNRVASDRLSPSLALTENDSHGFFRQVGGQIRTGWTDINVMDVAIALIKRTCT